MLITYRIAYSLFFCFLFFNGAGLTASYEIQEVKVTKINSLKELDPYKDLDRIYCYEEDFDQTPKDGRVAVQSGPFGVYQLTINGQAVGLKSVTPYEKKGILYGEEMTDIFPDYQSKGFGKILRWEVVEIFRPFIGTEFTVEAKDSEAKQKQLSYVYCDNEWGWGDNGASLKTSLDAGYGIVCIDTMMDYALVQMIYPKTQYHWSDHRVEMILKVSRLNSAEPQQESIPYLISILKDLNYTQDTELSTFYAIVNYITRCFKGETSYKLLEEYVSQLPSESITHALKRISSNKKQGDQVIDPDLISCIHLDRCKGISLIELLRLTNRYKEFQEIIDQEAEINF